MHNLDVLWNTGSTGGSLFPSNLAFDEHLDIGDVSREGNLGVGAGAGHKPDRLSDQFACGSVVRDHFTAVAYGGERFKNNGDLKGLGCLNGPQEGAVKRAVHG